MAEIEERIFHARFGNWQDEKTLVFGNTIDIRCTIAPMADDENPHNPKNQIQIAEGIFAVAMAGIDSTAINIYQVSENPAVRFLEGSFAWNQTPAFLSFKDGKSILEITHDDKTDVDRQNAEYRLHRDPPIYDKTHKLYVFSHLGGKLFETK